MSNKIIKCNNCNKDFTIEENEEITICLDCIEEIDTYHEDLVQFLIEENILDCDWQIYEAENKEKDKIIEMESVLYLLSTYNPKCIINTLLDVQDLWDEFEESYTNEDRENYPDELCDYIFNTWKNKHPIEDEERTRDYINIFTILITCYGIFGSIRRVIEIMEVCDVFEEEYFKDEE